MNRNRFPYPKLTVLISTPNIDQMAAFYTAQLGLRPVPGAPDGIVALSKGACRHWAKRVSKAIECWFPRISLKKKTFKEIGISSQN